MLRIADIYEKVETSIRPMALFILPDGEMKLIKIGTQSFENTFRLISDKLAGIYDGNVQPGQIEEDIKVIRGTA